MLLSGKLLSTLAMAMLLSSSMASLLRDKYLNSSGSERSSSESSSGSTEVSTSGSSSSSSSSSHSSSSSSSSSSKSSSSSSSSSSTSKSSSKSLSSDSSSESSSSKSSSKSSSSESSSSSEGEDKLSDPEMVFRCDQRSHLSAVYNVPIDKDLGVLGQFLEDNNIKASFVVDGVELNSSLDWRAEFKRPLIEKLQELGHTLIVKPHIDDNVPFRKLCKERALLAVQKSAMNIEDVVGGHPRLVHIPGRKIEDDVLEYLAEHQYFVVDWKRTFAKRGKDLTKIKKHKTDSKSKNKEKNGKSKKEKKNKNHRHGSSRRKTDRREKNRKVKVEHKKAKGYLYYGNNDKDLLKDVEATVKRAWNKGYQFVPFEVCVPRAKPYRRI